MVYTELNKTSFFDVRVSCSEKSLAQLCLNSNLKANDLQNELKVFENLIILRCFNSKFRQILHLIFFFIIFSPYNEKRSLAKVRQIKKLKLGKGGLDVRPLCRVPVWLSSSPKNYDPQIASNLSNKIEDLFSKTAEVHQKEKWDISESGVKNIWDINSLHQKCKIYAPFLRSICIKSGWIIQFQNKSAWFRCSKSACLSHMFFFLFVLLCCWYHCYLSLNIPEISSTKFNVTILLFIFFHTFIGMSRKCFLHFS